MKKIEDWKFLIFNIIRFSHETFGVGVSIYRVVQKYHRVSMSAGESNFGTSAKFWFCITFVTQLAINFYNIV